MPSLMEVVRTGKKGNVTRVTTKGREISVERTTPKKPLKGEPNLIPIEDLPLKDLRDAKEILQDAIVMLYTEK